MSSTANQAELRGDGQISGNSGPEEINGRGELVQGLELVPVPLTSTWLEFDQDNEYVQLCDGIYNGYAEFDCGLPLLLKEFGDPLADYLIYCDCDFDEAHTCWLMSELCGTRGKHCRRRRKLVNALHEAISALENGLLCMYQSSTIYNSNPQGSGHQAGRLTPGLHKLATMRLNSLTQGVERLQEFHKQSMNISPDELNPSIDTCDDDTQDDDSDNDSSDSSNEDLLSLERQLSACKTELLKPLEGVAYTKESIIKASEHLKLAVRTYDNAGKGPRSAVRGYYKECVGQVADAMPSLEHYSQHPICDGLDCDLRKIDDGYRKARDDMYRLHNDAEMIDGLRKTLWSIWDETRSHFEGDIPLVVE